MTIHYFSYEEAEPLFQIWFPYSIPYNHYYPKYYYCDSKYNLAVEWLNDYLGPKSNSINVNECKQIDSYYFFDDKRIWCDWLHRFYFKNQEDCIYFKMMFG